MLQSESLKSPPAVTVTARARVSECHAVEATGVQANTTPGKIPGENLHLPCYFATMAPTIAGERKGSYLPNFYQ